MARTRGLEPGSLQGKRPLGLPALKPGHPVRRLRRPLHASKESRGIGTGRAADGVLVRYHQGKGYLRSGDVGLEGPKELVILNRAELCSERGVKFRADSKHSGEIGRFETPESGPPSPRRVGRMRVPLAS